MWRSIFLTAFVSLAINGQATPSNTPPIITVIEPVSTVTLYSLSNSVTIRANAMDLDGNISEVRLLENGTVIASDFQAPYEFTYKGATFGNYVIEVQAVDNLGATHSQSRTVQYVRIFDNFGLNILVSMGTNLTLHGTTVEATRQKGEPNHAGNAGGKSIWWAWRPTATGTVTMDTFGSDFDTVLGVYTNAGFTFPTPAPFTNLVSVAANDDDSANPPLSRVKFTAFAMQTYYIAVDGRDGFAGNVALNIRQSPSRAAVNDMLASAARIFGGGLLNGTNVGATKQPGEPDHAGNIGGASVWWRYDGAPTQSPIQISTAGSTFDTLLAVYTNVVANQRETAPAIEALRLVAANDDGGSSTSRTSVVEFVPRPGTTYWIAVDGYNGAEGAIRISMIQNQQGPRPLNDSFIGATVLQGSSALTNANTRSATSEFNEPRQLVPPMVGRSVWYRWVAPDSGPVHLSTRGSDFDTLLGVYIGTNMNNLQFIALNDDDGGLQTSALVFAAVEGTEYRIVAAGFQGVGGDLVLALNQPSMLAPRLVTSFTQGRLSLSTSNLDGTFVLETSSDLINWSYVREVASEEIELNDISGSEPRQRFYRLREIK